MLAIGENFLHYKILSAIGSGGMGEVYLAKDNNLERKVAIKVLRKKFGKNEEGLVRFVREARSASALNHPNIITIYEIGESNGSNYIASEYIDGKTLHSRLKGEHLSVSEVLDISIQVAEAVSAAHAAGIIHRDIKPENVMIRKDGYVKVLDFGLAKLSEREFFSADHDAVTHKLMRTNPGVVMGTVSYMSPEQTRGRDVDTRSDIWSIGVLIYEMVSGALPFAGETPSDVIAAILTSNPRELSQQSPEVPKELDHIVRKALRKNREERYQDIKDMLIDLRDVRSEVRGSGRSSENGYRYAENFVRADMTDEPLLRGAATRPVGDGATRSISDIFMDSFRHHPKGITVGIAALIVLATVTAAALIAYVRTPVDPGAFQSMRFSKITSSGNAEGGQIAVSPDGKYVAYAIRSDADQSLWVKNVPTDSSIQIVGPSPARFRGLTFHPDGGYVYYVLSEPGGLTSVNRISVFGGETRRVATDAEGPVAFSPKGERFAFVRGDRILMTTDADGGGEEEIAKAATGEVWWLPTWSPDGKTIAFTVYSNATSRIELAAVNLESKQREKINSPNWLRISGLVWNADGKSLRLSGRDNETQLSQVWSVGFPDGRVARVTNDPGSYQGLSLTADGKTAVSVQENRLSNIWIADERTGHPKKITSDTGRDEGMSGVAWSPDGAVVYTTRVAGTQDIWSVDADGKNNRQLTANAGSNFHPAVSPDSRFIAFTSDRTGSLNLWRMDRSGENAVQLTNLPGNESQAAFTPDGNWIIFQRSGDGNNAIWKVPANGGEAIQISPNGAEYPRISPDGKSIACGLTETGGAKKIAILSTENGALIAAHDFPAVVATSIFRWSGDGQSLIYLNRLDGGYELWSQPIAGGSPRRIAASAGDRIYAFDISRNGKGIVFSRGTESSDAILISSIR